MRRFGTNCLIVFGLMTVLGATSSTAWAPQTLQGVSTQTIPVSPKRDDRSLPFADEYAWSLPSGGLQATVGYAPGYEEELIARWSHTLSPHIEAFHPRAMLVPYGKPFYLVIGLRNKSSQTFHFIKRSGLPSSECKVRNSAGRELGQAGQMISTLGAEPLFYDLAQDQTFRETQPSVQESGIKGVEWENHILGSNPPPGDYTVTCEWKPISCKGKTGQKCDSYLELPPVSTPPFPFKVMPPERKR